MTREAKRPGERAFQFPRCTIHGSGEERLKTFMNFSSPARRKLHKNSWGKNNPGGHIEYLFFLDDKTFRFGGCPLPIHWRRWPWALPCISMGRFRSFCVVSGPSGLFFYWGKERFKERSRYQTIRLSDSQMTDIRWQKRHFAPRHFEWGEAKSRNLPALRSLVLLSGKAFATLPVCLLFSIFYLLSSISRCLILCLSDVSLSSNLKPLISNLSF